MTLNFDCIFYYVSDLERSVAFYQEVLGFKLVSKDSVARFDVDGVRIELVPTAHRDRYGGHGNARLCLRVDHLNAARNDLLKLGVTSTEPVGEGPGLLATIHDLDGNEICLWQQKQVPRGQASSMWQ